MKLPQVTLFWLLAIAPFMWLYVYIRIENYLIWDIVTNNKYLYVSTRTFTFY